MSANIYHPKGSMCSVCKGKHSNCSGYDFSKMRVTKQYSLENDVTVFKVVICDNFKKED